MSDITYMFIQLIVLVCYASWVFYRIGYNKGYRKCEHDMEFEWEVNGEFVNEQQHKGE
jgi:hypothetical protein